MKIDDLINVLEGFSELAAMDKRMPRNMPDVLSKAAETIRLLWEVARENSIEKYRRQIDELDCGARLERCGTCEWFEQEKGTKHGWCHAYRYDTALVACDNNHPFPIYNQSRARCKKYRAKESGERT